MTDRAMYDAASGAVVFPTVPPVDIVAGYVDGNFRSAPGLFARYPFAKHLPITVSAFDVAAFAHAVDGVLCLDIERSDATPDQAGPWVRVARSAGVAYPWCYFSTSNHDAVVGSLQRSGVSAFLWGAQWDGDPRVMPGYVAKQYASLDAYDLSAVIPYVPGLDTVPPATRPKGDADMFLLATNETPSRGFRIYPGAEKLIAVKCSTVDVPGQPLTSEYARVASGDISHREGVGELEVVLEVQDALKAQGRPYDSAAIAAAIES